MGASKNTDTYGTSDNTVAKYIDMPNATQVVTLHAVGIHALPPRARRVLRSPARASGATPRARGVLNVVPSEPQGPWEMLPRPKRVCCDEGGVHVCVCMCVCGYTSCTCAKITDIYMHIYKIIDIVYVFNTCMCLHLPPHIYLIPPPPTPNTP